MLQKFFPIILIVFAFTLVPGQDSQELKAEREGSKKLKGEHPLVAVMKSKPSSLKRELEGVHPRVYFTQDEIEAL